MRLGGIVSSTIYASLYLGLSGPAPPDSETLSDAVLRGERQGSDKPGLDLRATRLRLNRPMRWAEYVLFFVFLFFVCFLFVFGVFGLGFWAFLEAGGLDE